MRRRPTAGVDPGGEGTPSYRWVDDEPSLTSVVEELATEPRFGIDTEFHRERTYYPHLALVQIAWRSGIALVDPLVVDVKPLAEILSGDGLAVLHACDQDLEVLEQTCGALPRRVFDTQLAAGFVGYSSPSLSTLVERLLGRRMTKGDRLTDWTRRPLTADQRAYAAGDVAHLLDLYAELSHRLAGMGRLDWALEECAGLLTKPRGRPEPEVTWWKLRDSRQLKGRARGVAQEVAAWRERVAAETDRPPRFVLPDLAILAMAQRPPRSPADLEEIRGLEGRAPRGEIAAEILSAVERGVALAEEDLRLPPSVRLDSSLRVAASLASAWLSRRAAELRLDASLLGTRSDVEALLRRDPEARLASGWRRELAGSGLTDLVEGRAALAIDPADGLVLEKRSGQRTSTASEGPTTPA